jgi:hypothetical protein
MFMLSLWSSQDILWGASASAVQLPQILVLLQLKRGDGYWASRIRCFRLLAVVIV